MASDYEGEPKEFALVVPVPTFIERNQISVVEPATVDHLDAYTAPRLVEYHDPDPCQPPMFAMRRAPVPKIAAGGVGAVDASDGGVASGESVSNASPSVTRCSASVCRGAAATAPE